MLFKQYFYNEKMKKSVTIRLQDSAATIAAGICNDDDKIFGVAAMLLLFVCSTFALSRRRRATGTAGEVCSQIPGMGGSERRRPHQGEEQSDCQSMHRRSFSWWEKGHQRFHWQVGRCRWLCFVGICI